jgi:gas vesicle protein
MIQSLVCQSAVVNIRDVGFGAALGAGDVLVGRQESPFADAADELGIGAKEKVSIQEILENIRGLTADAKRDAPEILAHLKTTSANLEEASGKVKGTLKTVQDILDENRPDVRDAVANARDLAEQANEDGKAILARTKDATETAAAILDENRDDVRDAVANARDLAEQAKEDGKAILDNAKAGAESLKGALADLRVMTGDSKDIVVWNKGNLNKTLQNFKDTSEHLKALAQEVRRAPWRLFATPDKKEVESLNLYDAARQFASAASDLEGLADTLKVMLEAQEKGVAVDPQVLQGMVDRLQDTFNHYTATEEALWKEFDRIKK